MHESKGLVYVDFNYSVDVSTAAAAPSAAAAAAAEAAALSAEGPDRLLLVAR